MLLRRAFQITISHLIPDAIPEAFANNILKFEKHEHEEHVAFGLKRLFSMRKKCVVSKHANGDQVQKSMAILTFLSI